jgi:hypothetical protein
MSTFEHRGSGDEWRLKISSKSVITITSLPDINGDKAEAGNTEVV